MNSRAIAALGILLAAGCAGARPKAPMDPSAASLYRDLQRLVSLSEAKGWAIDRIEAEEMLPDALMSLCRVRPEGRAALRRWLEARIAAEGGPVERAFADSGGDMDAVEELVELARIRLVFERAERAAPADCPFWVTPEEPFRGRQLLDDRWLVSLGGGGQGIVVRRPDDVDLNFGGAGRLLFGRAFGPRWAALAGFDVGASASFPRDDSGERGALVLGVDTALPLALRYRMVNTYFEAEVGYLGRVTEDDPDVDSGAHVGLAVGGHASRKRWLFPGAAFGVIYEQIFAEEKIHMLKVGLRVVFDLGF